MGPEEVAIIRLWDKTQDGEPVKSKDIIFCYTMTQLVEELEKARHRKDYDSLSVYIAHVAIEDMKFS